MFSVGASTIAWHISGTIWLIFCLEILKRHCWRVYESPVAQNRNVTAILSWTGIVDRNLVSLFTVFGPTKFISTSQSPSAIRVNFLYRRLNSRHFKPATKIVPLYTDLFLYNSVYHQCVARRFLLLGTMWYSNIKAALFTCKDGIFPSGAANTGGSQRETRSPECAPSCPKLNLGASRTPREYLKLLLYYRMLKGVRGLRMHVLSTLLSRSLWTTQLYKLCITEWNNFRFFFLSLFLNR